MPDERDWHVAAEVLRTRLLAAGEGGVSAMTQGAMGLVLYAPGPTSADEHDDVHLQDELYLVTRGSSRFDRGGEEREMKAGDALFVPAGMRHRFAWRSEDFESWIIFYGPIGGESGEER